jgi:hypothetical protein
VKAAPRHDAAPPELPPRPSPLDEPEPWRLAGLDGPAPEFWDGELADRIAMLCRRSPNGLSSWTLTVPLDPAVLPQTELQLALSIERLLLRFHTHSPYSQALVKRHRERLAELLVRALPFEREIDIETM